MKTASTWLGFMLAQAMESKMAFDGLFPSLNHRPPVRTFLIGLVNHLMLARSGLVWPQMFHWGRFPRLRSFPVFVAMAVWCIAVCGAAPTNVNVIEFESSLPKPGSIQWEREHRIYKERQELYRKRVAIPETLGTNVPIAAGAYLNFNRHKVEPPAVPTSGGYGFFFRLLLYLVLLILAGVYSLRRFAPHLLVDMNQRYNPWVVSQVTDRDFITKVRVEDEAFSKYLTTFQTGPSAVQAVLPAEKVDSLAEFWPKAREILAAQRMLP